MQFPQINGFANVRFIEHDYHVRSLSSARLCKRKWENLWTGQYLFAGASDVWNAVIPAGFNVGIRWKGSPTFEHEQLRLFPAQKLFDAIKDSKAKIWSLQTDDKAAETSRPQTWWISAVFYHLR